MYWKVRSILSSSTTCQMKATPTCISNLHRVIVYDVWVNHDVKSRRDGKPQDVVEIGQKSMIKIILSWFILWFYDVVLVRLNAYFFWHIDLMWGKIYLVQEVLGARCGEYIWSSFRSGRWWIPRRWRHQNCNVRLLRWRASLGLRKLYEHQSFHCHRGMVPIKWPF